MIKPEEIDDIFDIGELNGQPVKVIKTIGGFYAATAKEANGKDAVLAGGSHPALVRHQLVKRFGKNFHPSLLKSENKQTNAQVIEKTKFLSKDQIDKGFDLNAVIQDGDVNLIIQHHGVPVLSQKALAKSDSLEIRDLDIKNFEKSQNLFENGISKNLLLAFAETAKDLKLKKISYQEQPKTVSADAVLRSGGNSVKK